MKFAWKLRNSRAQNGQRSAPSLLRRGLTMLAFFVVSVAILLTIVMTVRLGPLPSAKSHSRGLFSSWFHRKPRLQVEPKAAPLFYQSIGTSAEGEESKSVESMPGDRYTLEIFQAHGRDEAEKMINTLAQKGIEAYYTPVLINGKVIYRVRRGLYTDSQQAELAMAELNAKAKVNSRVVLLR